MKPLTIELVKGQKQELQSLGWKTPKGSDCRLHFYALDPTGKPLVVTLKPALPVFYDPLGQVRAVFSCEPFPAAVCVEISTCRLLPPPCYESREDFEGQLPCHSAFEPWKWIYWQTHRQVLIEEPSDDDPLQDRLAKWLAAKRGENEYWVGNWRNEIDRLTTAPLAELNLANEEERAKWVKKAEVQLGMYESEKRIEGVPSKGWLKLTLEDVKRGWGGIRDAWMQEAWAKKNGEDLELMARERRRFGTWLVTHTGTPAIISNMTTKHRREGIATPDLGEKFEQNPQFMMACARVRYRARFADNAGSAVYLEDCEPPREELDAAELDEVAKLRGQPVSTVATIQQAAAELSRQIGEVTKGGAAALAAAGDAAHAKTVAGAETINAATHQMDAKTKALSEVIAPLNRLYSKVELTEIRKRAHGKGVPDLFADWALTEFQRSNPARLPTKGDAFNNCGPGTLIGKKLEQAGFGISMQRLADHLTVLRRLLEENGWIARRTPGKPRTRAPHFQPDDRLEDLNQPTPAESAEDRDEERQAVGSETEKEEDQEQGGDSCKPPDAG